MKTKKVIRSLLLCAFMFLGLTGCQRAENSENGQPEEQTVLTIAQNDYAGAYVRLTKVQEDVLTKMEILEQHNYAVQTGNPEDYWAEDAYYFLHFLPVYTEAMENTAILNEVDAFSAIQEYLTGLLETAGYSKVSIVREAAHTYVIKYSGYFLDKTKWEELYGTRTMQIAYDPAYNRIRVTSEILFNNALEATPDFFYEFAELGKGIYALQNDTERLLVRYDATGEIHCFYYSSLIRNEAVDLSIYFPQELFSELKLSYGYQGAAFQVPGREDMYLGYMNNGSVRYFQLYIGADGGKAVRQVVYGEASEEQEETENGEEPHTVYVDNTEEIRAIGEIDAAAIKGYYEITNDSIYKDIHGVNAKEWVMEADRFEQTVVFEDGVLSIKTTNPFTGEEMEFSVRETP